MTIFSISILIGVTIFNTILFSFLFSYIRRHASLEMSSSAR